MKGITLLLIGGILVVLSLVLARLSISASPSLLIAIPLLRVSGMISIIIGFLRLSRESRAKASK
jgi:hypothetical protein